MGRPDSEPPEAVSDLQAVTLGPSSVHLTWSAPFDRGGLGRAADYELARSHGPVDDWSTAPRIPVPFAAAEAGAAETLTVRVPDEGPGRFRLRSRDASGNWSAYSNVAPTRTPALEPAWLRVGPSPGRPPIALAWRAISQPGKAPPLLAIHDLHGRRVRTFRLGPEPSGVTRWDGTDRDGRRLPAGLYFVRLSCPGGRVSSRFVLLP